MRKLGQFICGFIGAVLVALIGSYALLDIAFINTLFFYAPWSIPGILCIIAVIIIIFIIVIFSWNTAMLFGGFAGLMSVFI